jgi:hypothetical protein
MNKIKKIASKKHDQRYNEFLKYIQKRMKELAKDEKKFRDALTEGKKLYDTYKP